MAADHTRELHYPLSPGSVITSAGRSWYTNVVQLKPAVKLQNVKTLSENAMRSTVRAGRLKISRPDISMTQVVFCTGNMKPEVL